MKMKKKYIWVGLKHWVGRSSTTKHLFFFGLRINQKGLMVDCGATSHIVTKDTLTNCDETFDPEKHYMELADGSRQNNLVKKIGDVEVTMRDETGRPVKTTMKLCTG